MISNENVLHYIWKYKLFSSTKLSGTKQELIEIIYPGILNTDAGPDFSNAKIKINETLWAGTVEIHLRSSDWEKHCHQYNKSYDNVILHVVWEHDSIVYRTDGTEIPVLELNNFVDDQLIDKINFLTESEAWIPCENFINEINDFTITQCLDRVLVERLAYKSELIANLYKETKGSWEDTFYIAMARSFGFKVNAEPFEILAKRLSQQILAKHKHSNLQIEALIFGTAGFLDDEFQDDYPRQLKKEYQFLKAKYHIHTLEKHWWKFTRIRPDNFPTVRLAQFSALVKKSSHLFSKLLEIDEVSGYKILFKDLELNVYWEENYLFDKSKKRKSTSRLGEGSIDILLINTIAPVLFYYGKLLGLAHYQDKAVNLLQTLKPEQNSVIAKFKSYGVKVGSAFDSQALIQMKNFYCNQKKCLHCGVGIKILKG